MTCHQLKLNCHQKQCHYFTLTCHCEYDKNNLQVTKQNRDFFPICCICDCCNTKSFLFGFSLIDTIVTMINCELKFGFFSQLRKICFQKRSRYCGCVGDSSTQRTFVGEYLPDALFVVFTIGSFFNQAFENLQ